MIRRITQKVGLRRGSSASQNPERIVALQQMNDKRDPSGDSPIPGSVEENTEFGSPDLQKAWDASEGYRKADDTHRVRDNSINGFSTLHELHDTMKSNDILNLPENIYTAAIILPFTRDRNKSTFENYWRDFQVLLLVATNIVAQTFLIVYVQDTYDKTVDNTGRCGTDAGPSTDKRLRPVAEAIFVGYCLIDMVETWNMFWWWIDMSKAIPDWALTKISELLSCVFCACTRCCGKWNLVRDTQIVNKEGEESAFANEFHTRVTECSWIRKAFVLFIILCKFSLCANLANFGTGFLLISESNSDLILNALALTFILELDEMFYIFFLTTEMRVIVETFTPMVVVKTDENTGWFLRNTTIFARAMMLCVITLFMVSFYCTTLWSDGKLTNND